ncbi:MAG TPA: HAMP domain-containing sensor histidine kinase, partial [Opitutaceae bacterium]
RQRRLGWQIVGAGAALMLGGFAASHILSGRFSVPVEKLAHDSEENRTQRERAEAELKSTSAELQRAARFSADASHQLKTPVTVLRAGLEELLANGRLTPQQTDEISSLIHQTYRLSSVIEDLLLLSRMDAGQLKLKFGAVNLSELIEASLDDLGALPDAMELAVETDFPPGLRIAGEKRYTTLILQNLLENARKYNRPGGRIHIAAREEHGLVCLRIANTARRPISPEAQAHIFERFHRGVVGENIPGYGLGLNLAHELARIHDGDLRLVRSDDTWTEFEVRFRPAEVLANAQPRTS